VSWSSLAADVVGASVDAFHSLVARWAALDLPPGSVLGIAVASSIVAGAVVLVVVRLRRQRPVRAARPRSPRHAEVLELARRGAAPAVIARRTGLSYDAVCTILRTFADEAPRTKAVRNSRPRSAGFSFPRRARI
jgi:hypothetical protein